MKIAYLVPYVPNLVRVRSYKFIEYLSKCGIEISLFTIGTNRDDLAQIDQLKKICRDITYSHQPFWRSALNCLAALPTERSLQAVYSWNPGLGSELGRRVGASPHQGGFDLVLVEHLRGTRYAEYIRHNYPNMPLVWDSVDCISHLFQQAASQSKGLFGRFISLLDLKRTQRVEGRQVCNADHILVTSSVDREALLALVSGGQTPAPVSILSNGVDLDYYREPDHIQREPETIIFSGKMSYHANVTMATHLIRDIMPWVWQEKPNVRVVIAGKDPGKAIWKLAENPKVAITGTVDDLRPYLWKAAIAVVPLIYGAGIQNKILEAMAAGVPVVATSRTLPALRAEAGKDLLIADRPQQFAKQILRLMDEPAFYSEVRRYGLDYVKKFHDWRSVSNQLIQIFRQTIEQKKQNKI